MSPVYEGVIVLIHRNQCISHQHLLSNVLIVYYSQKILIFLTWKDKQILSFIFCYSYISFNQEVILKKIYCDWYKSKKRVFNCLFKKRLSHVLLYKNSNIPLDLKFCMFVSHTSPQCPTTHQILFLDFYIINLPSTIYQ